MPHALQAILRTAPTCTQCSSQTAVLQGYDFQATWCTTLPTAIKGVAVPCPWRPHHPAATTPPLRGEARQQTRAMNALARMTALLSPFPPIRAASARLLIPAPPGPHAYSPLALLQLRRRDLGVSALLTLTPRLQFGPPALPSRAQ